jgi:hypothetical protein
MVFANLQPVFATLSTGYQYTQTAGKLEGKMANTVAKTKLWMKVDMT